MMNNRFFFWFSVYPNPVSMAICRMVDADINGEPNDGNATADKQKCYEYVVPGRSKSDPDRKAYVWASSKKCDDYNQVDDSYCANTMAL